MTAATLDPAAAIATVGHQLFGALRELVDRGEPNDVPALLDEVTKLLRRARGKVARATRRDAERRPTEVKAAGTTVAKSKAPPATPATVTTKGPSKAVTAAVPDKGSGRQPSTQQLKRPGHPAPASTRPARPPRTRRWLLAAVAVAIAVVLIVMLAGCSDSPASSPVVPPDRSAALPFVPPFVLPAEMPPLKCGDLEPPPVRKPVGKVTGRRCVDPDGAVRWINAFYRCADGRIWPVLGTHEVPATAPTGRAFGWCVGAA